MASANLTHRTLPRKKTLYENGWGKHEPGWINNTTGRAIGALTACYRVTGDERAMGWWAITQAQARLAEKGP